MFRSGLSDENRDSQLSMSVLHRHSCWRGAMSDGWDAYLQAKSRISTADLISGDHLTSALRCLLATSSMVREQAMLMQVPSNTTSGQK